MKTNVTAHGGDDPTADFGGRDHSCIVAVRDLVVDDLDHLHGDFHAWDRTVALAGESTVQAVRACVEGA